MGGMRGMGGGGAGATASACRRDVHLDDAAPTCRWCFDTNFARRGASCAVGGGVLRLAAVAQRDADFDELSRVAS